MAKRLWVCTLAIAWVVSGCGGGVSYQFSVAGHIADAASSAPIPGAIAEHGYRPRRARAR